MRILFLMTLSLVFMLVGAHVHADNPGSIIGLPDLVYTKAILYVFAFNTFLSALNTVMKKFDGVNPGDQIPAGFTGLKIVNATCAALGKILDWVQGNVQH